MQQQQKFRLLGLLLIVYSSINLTNADHRFGLKTIIERDLRIVGGSPARPQQFPHAVALIIHLTQSRSSFCGGSIIHANYILTAAHCLDELLRVEVLAGIQNIFRGEPESRQMVDTRDARQHPRYNPHTLINDIGLLFLRRRLAFTPSVQPVALPTRVHANNRFIGSIGTIIGWGRTRDSSQALSDPLRFVSLEVVSDRVCDIYNREYRFFTPTNICVDGTHGSSCNGDSGGGMHVTLNGRITVIGVVSYGSSSCENGLPVAMTRVTSYLDWIASNTGLRF